MINVFYDMIYDFTKRKKLHKPISAALIAPLQCTAITTEKYTPTLSTGLNAAEAIQNNFYLEK